MAAFQFPDPADKQTVVNPITGSTYQWKEPPGKWVVSVSLREVGDIIWEGDNPPNPIGDYKLWYSTDTLELYFYYCDANGTCAWLPTSAPITMLEDLEAEVQLALAKAGVAEAAANANLTTIGLIDSALTEVEGKLEETIDGLGQVTLEEVLTNGNVADKDIYLTHLDSSNSDIIDISPEKAKIIIATEGSKVPTFELQHYDVRDDSQVKLELDEDGTRFDIECDEKVNNIHFRFEDDVKLELNKDGDAVFGGDVDIKGHLDVNKGISTAGTAYMKFSPKEGNNQLLTLDSGSSYLPMLHLKSFSSTTTTDGEETPEVDTAARKDVLIVRASGEAELSGHLSLMPGTKDNQAVTYNQLLELEQEIEALVPSVERGQFEITLDPVDGDTASEGKFNMLRDYTQDDKDAATAVCFQEYSDCIFNDPEGTRPCQADLERCSNAIPAVGSKVTTEDFGLVKQLKFSIKDINGNNHGWTTVAVGQLIEVFNQDDDSYLIAEITETEGMWYELITFTVTPVKYKGSATGVCRIKIFEMDLSAGSDLDFVRTAGSNKVEDDWKITSASNTHIHVQGNQTKIYWLQDPQHDQHPVTRGFANTNYLKKAGDQMTGTLETTGRILIRPGDQGAKGANNMLVVNQLSANGSGSIVRIQQDNDDIIKVQDDRTTTFNHNRITEVGDPTDGEDATNRQWVEDYVAANVRRLWKWTGDQSSNPGAGKFSFAQSGAGYLYFDHRPTVGTELFNDANQYLVKGGDSIDDTKELGFAMFTIWEWTGTQFIPCKSGHVSSTGIRTGKNNEAWRFSSNKNTIISLRNLTTDGLYAICVSGTILA